MAVERRFDDTAREALRELLGRFWILRDRDPEMYQLIREREKALRDYVLDKFGYRLIVHRHFAKLEKIPARAEAWMGIRQPRDYALFCCLLAYLESKAVDEQFLLSDVCEELEAVYPGDPPPNWRNYEHRKSLVRVLQQALEFGIMRVVDGDTAAFHFDEQSEVLYEVTVVSRYFMRSYPKDLFRFTSKEEILAADLTQEEGPARRRHRVYRQLVLSPSFAADDLEAEDYEYVIRYRHRLRDDLEEHTGMELEVYEHVSLLKSREATRAAHLFPDQKAISDIALQFAGWVREQVREGELEPDSAGQIVLTRVEMERAVKACKQQFGQGWSKQYREATLALLTDELTALLLEWKRAEDDEESGMFRLRPLLNRITGRYPDDFTAGKEEVQVMELEATAEAGERRGLDA